MAFSSPYQNIRTITFADSPFTVPAGTNLVLVDCTGGAVSVILYSPGSQFAANSVPLNQTGQVAVIKTDSSGNDVTVSTAAGSIVGPTVLADEGAAVQYTSDGSATWFALAGATQALAPDSDPTFDSVTVTDFVSAKSVQASQSLATGFATTATAAATTTLTNLSKQIQEFTGVTTQIVVLPVTSTVERGGWFEIVNNSTGVVTVQSSGANAILAMPAGSRARFVCILASGTTAASWALTSPSNIGTAVGAVLSSSPTAGIGYAAGAGGAVTQATDKSTTVVSNTITTAVTLNNAALAAATIVSFTFANSSIAATDTVVIEHQSAGTSAAYSFNAFPGAGSAVISVRNNTAGSLSEAIVLRITVLKSVSA